MTDEGQPIPIPVEILTGATLEAPEWVRELRWAIAHGTVRPADLVQLLGDQSRPVSLVNPAADSPPDLLNASYAK